MSTLRFLSGACCWHHRIFAGVSKLGSVAVQQADYDRHWASRALAAPLAGDALRRILGAFCHSARLFHPLRAPGQHALPSALHPAILGPFQLRPVQHDQLHEETSPMAGGVLGTGSCGAAVFFRSTHAAT